MKVNIKTDPGMRASASEYAVYILAAGSLANLIKVQHERLSSAFSHITMEIEFENGLSSLNMGNLRINVTEEKNVGSPTHVDKLLIGFKHDPATHTVDQFFYRSTPTTPSNILNILTRKVEMPTENPPATVFATV